MRAGGFPSALRRLLRLNDVDGTVAVAAGNRLVQSAGGLWTPSAMIRTGTLAARPAASSAPLGCQYLDTTTGVVWTCILVGSTPTWWSPAKGRVVVTADYAIAATTGGYTFDVLTGATWAAEGLVGFTHAAATGVLTYTGPGEVVTIEWAANASGGAGGFRGGISIGGAAPATGAYTTTTLNSAAQHRICSQRVLLTTGATIAGLIGTNVSLAANVLYGSAVIIR